jgi:hypothetical protein
VARVAALALCAACAGQGETITRAAVTPAFRTDGFAGARATASAGQYGVQLGIGAIWDELARPMDPNRHAAGGVEVNLRASLFGAIADDHRLERYFDLGFEGGAGGGFAHPASLESYGELWGGGWIDVGTGNPSWPVLALGARRVTYSGEWNTETIFTVGLAWVWRSTQSLLGY